MSIYPTTVPSKRLSESITSASTSFKLNSISGWDGNPLTSTDFGTVAYAVFRNSSSTLMEIMEIDPTTITSASSPITINKRGMKFDGDLTTEISANKLTWVKGDTVVDLGTDVPQLLKSYVDIYGDQTVAGVKTFSSSPIVPTPTTATQAVNKSYADALAIAGAPDATTTSAGLVEEATEAEIEAGTAAGSDARLFVNPSTLKSSDYGTKVYERTGDYAADAGANDTYAITLAPVPTAYTTGMEIAFRPNTSNTGACTINVNSLGAQSIKKGGTTDPATGDIIAGRIYKLVYDGTNFQLVNTQGVSQSGSELYAASSGGSDTYAITLSPVPLAYATGMTVHFKADVANTGAATLNVNSLGAKSILRPDGSALSTGDIAANQIVKVIYDGTNMLLLSPTSHSMDWEQLGETTASGAVNSLDVSSLPARKELMITLHIVGPGGGGNRPVLTFNGDTAANYSTRKSTDGGADATATAQSGIVADSSNLTTSRYITIFVSNRSATIKQVLMEEITGGAAGTAPGRTECVAVWDNTSAQISQVTFTRGNGTESMAASGSRLTVYGSKD